MAHPQPERTQRRPNRARTALIWFRNDLRLADHRPLTAALDRAERIVAVYVLDEKSAGRWALGGAARWWLHHSLLALDRSLRSKGGALILRRGDPATIVPEIARQAGAAEVHCGLSHEPALRAVDEATRDALTPLGIALRQHPVSTLFDIGAIRTRTGTIYGIFTPFARACRALPEPEPPLPAPERIPAAEGEWKTDRLEQWGLLPTRPDWAQGLRDSWQPGESGGHARMQRFLADHLERYGEQRDMPGNAHGTSMLSPHLRWGELSALQVWHAARGAHEAAGHRGRDGIERFQNELLWHEFAAYLLLHHPSLPDQPLRPEFSGLRWRRDAKGLEAWQQGRTGIPIVDAGMRQLWQIGWMHNRVRMIAASLLVKHLLLAWQVGEAWFWDTLVDGDLATNSASWQWVAGTGTDAQPFFRIFNPVTQSRKFDPDGDYIRRWVPELAGLATRHLHAPWEAPAEDLAQAGIELGRQYPHPIVSLQHGRERALDAFRREVKDFHDRDPSGAA